jgi:hypothetical protein
MSANLLYILISFFLLPDVTWVTSFLTDRIRSVYVSNGRVDEITTSSRSGVELSLASIAYWRLWNDDTVSCSLPMT